ncbi:hypothetical protein BUALT_Bualt10G0074300 [Buddleja alternifolia]|uniref:F-box domain-containing protein n=1 Tax=Buddleja alternifolia TaxID=168488 RepID=A0AAV6X7P5_9LAMI|nr:hypothetical protein BUALT_Bualt10G0074300 [Buddleja alternifolia]
MNRSCIIICGTMEDDQKPLTTGSSSGVSQFWFMELPIPVLHDILFRLPVASIMQLKLVCRSLYKLVSSRDFSVNYSTHSPFSTFLLRKDHLDPLTLYLLEISDSCECIRTVFKPKVPDWSEEDSILSIVGTCNGFLCLSVKKWSTKIVYVCNLITGECIAVAEHMLKERERCTVEFGFGFCSECEILTIGVDDTWRGLDCVANPTIPYPFALSSSVNLSDALHWLVVGIGPTWISTFDFGEEKIGQLPHPHGLEMHFGCMHLLSTNNQLCLVDESNPFEIVMWKMKEYGVAESWTKDMVLQISVPFAVRRAYLKFVPRRQQGKLEYGDGCYAVEGRLPTVEMVNFDHVLSLNY